MSVHSTPKHKQTAVPVRYKKRVEGVKPSKAIKELLAKAIKLAETSKDEGQNDSLLKLREWKSQENGDKVLRKWIPLSLISAMGDVLETKERDELDCALRKTSLVFTPKPPPRQLTDEEINFRKRMERLSLKSEERNYTSLTSNVNKTPVQDDITTRSMTYAASVGLNMIIAPLSFGCFMFFFAGGLLDYFFESEPAAHYKGPDIKRVIIGVVSGVIMLFIEMLLFVIRTHEMDSAITKKTKKAKNKSGAFSVYTSETLKTFEDKKRK